jgi:hypothetical protein
MYRNRIGGSVLACVVVTAAACGGGGDESSDTTLPPETTEASTTTSSSTTTRPPLTTTTTEVPEIPQPFRQPLTGVVVDSEDDKNPLPALAIKIDNNEELARENHTGIALADVVFEEIVENQDTRFAAVFHTNEADPVGPIRSGRSQDVDLLLSFNGPLFAWSGGNPGVTRLIRDSYLTDLNAGFNSGAYYRGPGPGPHDLYSSTERLRELTPDDHPGPPPQQWTYVLPDDEFEGDAEVEGFDLQMRSNSVSWDWSDDEGKFLRSQAGSPHMDQTYGRIASTNVVVMIVDYEPSQIDRRSPEAQTVGEGPAYLFSNGQVRPATWKREISIYGINFYDDLGEKIPFTPGNMWIELAENNGNDAPLSIPTELTIREADDGDVDEADSETDDDSSENSVVTGTDNT